MRKIILLLLVASTCSAIRSHIKADEEGPFADKVKAKLQAAKAKAKAFADKEVAANKEKLDDMVAAAKAGDFSRIVEDAKAVGKAVGADVKTEAATAVAPVAQKIEE